MEVLIIPHFSVSSLNSYSCLVIPIRKQTYQVLSTVLLTSKLIKRVVSLSCLKKRKKEKQEQPDLRTEKT